MRRPAVYRSGLARLAEAPKQGGMGQEPFLFGKGLDCIRTRCHNVPAPRTGALEMETRYMKSNNKPATLGVKLSLIALGTLAASIGCYGAYEQSAVTNGGYLMIAAPVVAGASALIPYFVERTWQAGHRIKAFVFALVLVPAAATVFFAAAERVHAAKSGAEAARAALRQAIGRASQAHLDAKAKADRAEQDAKTWRAKSDRVCSTVCQAKWEGEAKAARGREAEALRAVTTAQALSIEESAIKAPIWLLPIALDMFAFVSLWAGLSLSSRAPIVAPVPVAPEAPIVAPIAAPVAKPKKAKKTAPKKVRQALGPAGLRLVHDAAKQLKASLQT